MDIGKPSEITLGVSGKDLVSHSRTFFMDGHWWLASHSGVCFIVKYRLITNAASTNHDSQSSKECNGD